MSLADEFSRIRTLFWLQYPAQHVLNIPHTPLVTDNTARFVCFGSCFASHMHDSLCQVGLTSFRNLPTTFGYSFESLANLLRFATGPDATYADHIYNYSDSLGGHNPYLFHFDGRLHATRQETAALLEREVQDLREALRHCTPRHHHGGYTTRYQAAVQRPFASTGPTAFQKVRTAITGTASRRNCGTSNPYWQAYGWCAKAVCPM